MEQIKRIGIKKEVSGLYTDVLWQYVEENGIVKRIHIHPNLSLTKTLYELGMIPKILLPIINEQQMSLWNK